MIITGSFLAAYVLTYAGYQSYCSYPHGICIRMQESVVLYTGVLSSIAITIGMIIMIVSVSVGFKTGWLTRLHERDRGRRQVGTVDETQFVEELSGLCEAYRENGLDRETIAANLQHEVGVQLEAKRVEGRGANGEEQ